MRKILALVLALTMLLTLMVGCTKQEETPQVDEKPTDTPTTPSVVEAPTGEVEGNVAEGKKVVFLVNGNLGDKGFYDACAEGINRLGSEYGCETKIIEMGRDETTYETFFRDVSEQDWDLIVAATWSVAEVFAEVAADYPENNYLFLDGDSGADNMLGVTFRSNETAFMAGCLAAAKLSEGGDDLIDDAQKTLGIVASMDATNLNDFVVGFIEGVNYVDESIHVLTSYVGSFEDVATCLEMTTQLYNQGAQIVYAPASQSMVGAATASSNAGKYLIACDTDLYTIMVDTNPELVTYVMSSSLKKMGDAVVTAALGLWNGQVSVGETFSMGLAENAVGLADNANYQTYVSADIQTKMDEIAQKVASGEITIKSAYTMETDEIAQIRDSKKP